ncbi:MAG: peptide deformylase [Chloroflexi bacterium]|nr:peptide deformylase [Chloroflexota bacterium]
MAIRKIIYLDNPILRQRARKVTVFTPALKTLVGDMLETMRAAPGVGLAAPQVAVGQRVIVVGVPPAEADEADPNPDAGKTWAVVNPEIVKASKEMVDGTEACLSIPGYAGTVLRHKSVAVKGFNVKGKPIKIKVEDFTARIFQHEIDHLDGVLFIDRASEVWKAEEKPEGVAAE